MRRFFVTAEQIKDGTAFICGSDINHVKNVLRLKPNNEIIIADNQNNEYAAKIISIAGDKITCKIFLKRENKSDPHVKVTIAQGMPKNPKMDLIIEKCTELGAYRIIPVKCERSVVKISITKTRWIKIAQSASEQSGRLIIPEISPPTLFDEAVKTKEPYSLKLILWEEEKEKKLKDVLSKKPKIESIIALIGPEGGFSIEEAELAKQNGFIPVSLGPRILRTETTALAALSMIMYEFE